MKNILIVEERIHDSLYVKSKVTKYLEAFLVRDSHLKVLDSKDISKDILENIDTLIFIYPIIKYTYSSKILELLKEYEYQTKKMSVYCVALSDLYESESCEFSCRSIKIWCDQTNKKYRGSLMIGSIFEQDHVATKLVTINYLKKLSNSILEDSICEYATTMSNINKFLLRANRRVQRMKKRHKKKS